MPKYRQRPSSRLARRPNQGLKLGLETLESRDCPAVTFGFESGVLSISGDDQRNVIEIVQRNNGTVEVLGDGERRSFHGVSKIVAKTAMGDDQISAKYTGFL